MFAIRSLSAVLTGSYVYKLVIFILSGLYNYITLSPSPSTIYFNLLQHIVIHTTP